MLRSVMLFSTLLLLLAAPFVWADSNDEIIYPEPDGSWDKLPADGGEAGQFAMELFAAIKKKDYDRARKMVNREDKSDEDVATIFCNNANAENMRVVGGLQIKSGGNTLYLEFNGNFHTQIHLNKIDDGWDLTSCGSSW
jgi:hypothetical protein